MRANNFDGLRLVGALSVLYSHQFALVGLKEPVVFPGFPLAAFGVAIFFAMSGYLVSKSWQGDPNLGRFVARRMLRIWPALVVTVVLLTLGAGVFHGRAALPFLVNAAFIPWDGAFFKGAYTELNGSLWTIPREVLCYIGVCILGLLWRRGLGWPALGALAAATVAALLVGRGQRMFYLGSYFVVGAVACHVNALGKITLVSFAAGIVAAIAGAEFMVTSLLLLPLPVVYVGRQSWPVLRSAGRLGDLSYGLYLWAWPMTQVGVAVFGKDAPLPALLLWTLLSTTVLAWLSWHVIEKRALRLKPRSQARPELAVTPT